MVSQDLHNALHSRQLHHLIAAEQDLIIPASHTGQLHIYHKGNVTFAFSFNLRA